VSSWAKALEEKIATRTARPAVVGLGYVGLPLLAELARAGFRAIGVDVNAEKVEALRAGRSYVLDVPEAAIAPGVREGRILVSTDFDLLRDADTIDICVPTPLRKTKDPDVSFIVAATDEVAARFQPGKLVILESTTYPGTTEELLLPKLSASGLKVGEDFFLAFSPERVDPGNPQYVTRNIPKVVGGVTPHCTRLAQQLYETTVERVVPVSSTRVAEMVKLLENTYRSVNIALVNELALLCDRMDLNVWEVIEAAATKPFGFMPFYPGPGLGGHCIPIDPFYLTWKAREFGALTKFIELAGEINTAMPDFVVQRTMEALNEVGKPLKGARVLMMGLAYKANVDDDRESPSYHLIEKLEAKGAIVEYNDPYIPQIRPSREFARYAGRKSVEISNNFDLLLIATAHDEYKKIDFGKFTIPIVDTRNIARATGKHVVAA
jgi:UDP-N-acetyl-D-glucosamine dehydrogenase